MGSAGPPDGPDGEVSRRGVRGDALRLMASTFGLLALELACIRWLSGQIRVFAYFNNLVLIGAFLGMGLGVALASRRPGLRHLTLPALAAFTLLIAFAKPLGLTVLSFPDLSVHLWGAEHRAALGQFATSVGVLLGLFWMVVGVFLLAGVAVGHYFARLETLTAYSCDLTGSLLGVLAVAAVTGLGTPPPVWFLVGALPFLLITPRWRSVAALAVVVGAAWISIDGAIYSPYNRIDLVREEGQDLRLRVNRDFHQWMHDLSDERIAGEKDPDRRRNWSGVRMVYDMPYVVGDRTDRALILGAGSGNDARAALRAGFSSVTAVDIDARILELGRELHPERPYDDLRVHPVVNDARAFLEQYDGAPFDVVSFGFLDSHAMFSTMSSLRLENYVYTEQGFRAAWRHVADGGHMAVTFSVSAGDWIADRLFWTLRRATGVDPVVVRHGLYGGATFLVGKEPLHLERIKWFAVDGAGTPGNQVTTTADDWPFLYIRPGQIPWGYLFLLTAVLASGAAAVRGVFGASVFGGGFDIPLFLMGAAFLLLETRGVTNLSLLFGTTWIVNAVVFSGILATVLVANLGVARFRPRREAVWFVPLLASLALLWAAPVGALNVFPLGVRWVVGALLVGLPVGFAGVIVSIRLSRSANATGALGSNLLGAVLGGCLEYLSMWLGLQALVLLAAALYLAALVGIRRTPAAAG